MKQANTNPYESPDNHGNPLMLDEKSSKRCWRDREWLIVELPAVLPRRCLWTNRDTDTREEQSFQVSPKWVKWCGPFASIVQLLAHDKIPVRYSVARGILSPQRFERLFGVMFVLTWLGWGLAACVVASQGDSFFTSPYVPVACTAVGAFILVLRQKKLELVQVRGDYVWFSGVGEPFLASLPDSKENPEIAAATDQHYYIPTPHKLS